MISFHVLIATVGRPTLQKMLDSLKPQLKACDHLTVVFDGHSIEPQFCQDQFVCSVHRYCEPEALGFWGHAIRNKYASLLDKTTFVMHADDDDVYANRVFDRLRLDCKVPNKIYIARMRTVHGIEMPETNAIVEKHIGTPCGIIPWDLNTQSIFEPIQTGDFSFQNTLAKIGIVDYLKQCIQIIRPDHTEFHARSYADRQPDLKKAFGYDIAKLWKHYKTRGIREGRNAKPM